MVALFARLQKDKFDHVWESHYLVYPGGLSLPRVLADVGRGARGRRLPASSVHRARRANRADIRGALPSDRKDRPRHPLGAFDGRSRRDRTRMHMRRFTRLTYGFSKKVANVERSVALHYTHDNFAKIHKNVTGDARDGSGYLKPCLEP